MKFKPIVEPVDGEVAVALVSTMDEGAPVNWHRRLNLFSGRALSDTALTTEQTGRAGRLAARGQVVSPGVIAGLEVGVEVEPLPVEDDARPVRSWLHLAPGSGVTVLGEDVFVARARRVLLDDVPIVTLAGLAGTVGGRSDLAGSAGVLVLQPAVARFVANPDPDDPCEQDPDNYAFEDWQLVDGATLALVPWPADWPAPPGAGPTRRNETAYRIFEAERLLGPDEYLPWAAAGVPLALIGFAADRGVDFLDRAAVVRAGGKPRHRRLTIPDPADPARRRSILPGAGDPFLWQARLQQFAEQMADPAQAGVAIAARQAEFRHLPPVGLLPKEAITTRPARNQFFKPYYLIDVAPVPLEQLDLLVRESAGLAPFDTGSTDQVRVLVPVPQVWYEPDLLDIEAVAPEFQETIDRFVAERTHWLQRRANVRAKRAALTAAIGGPGAVEPPAERDPGRLEADEAQTLPPPFASRRAHESAIAAGFHQHFFHGATSTLPVAAGDVLMAYVYLDPANLPSQVMLQWNDGANWEHRAYWGESRLPWGVEGTASRLRAGDLPPAGQWVRLAVPAAQVGLAGSTLAGMAFTLFGGRAAWGHAGTTAAGAVPPAGETVWVGDGLPAGATPAGNGEDWRWFGDDDLLTPFEESYGTDVADGGRRATPLVTLRQSLDEATPLTAAELAQLDARGLEGFIAFLEQKVDRANDTIDWGFLRVQTDIYRLRQLMLGNEAATRLATSTTLATIARGESAHATREDLKSFLARVKGQPATQMAPADAGGEQADPSGGAGGGAGAFRATDFAFTGFTSGETFVAGETAGDIGSALAGGALAEAVLGGVARPTQLQPSLPLSTLLSRETQIEAIRAFEPAAVATETDVIEQPPIVGKAYNFRTISIADRIQEAPAPEAKSFAVASKYDVIQGLANLDISVDDLSVPGFYAYRDGQLQTVEIPDPLDPARRKVVPVERAQTFAAIKADGFRLAREVLLDRHDLDPANADEGAFFSAGVRALDHTTAMLRLVEGRIASYRQALALCRTTLAQLREGLAGADRRLKVIADELAEARHDVAVARALLAEEQARVQAINDRRSAIIAEHVTFLVYCRPRTTDLRRPMPARPLDPGLAERPVPACLSGGMAVPPELRRLADLLREAPLTWLPALPPLLDRLARLEVLHEALQFAQVRAQAPALARPVAQSDAVVGGLKLAQGVASVLSAQQQVVARHRTLAAGLNLSLLAGLSWATARDQAGDVLTVGDLLAGGHGRGDVAQAAARELDDIAQIAGCLYAEFGQVLPALRLEWAERLSQYDAPVNLRNLASLPRWGEIDRLERRGMQELVDWLYGRVDPRQPQAVAFVSDLVRLAILLASHAPVNRIIAGHVKAPTTVRPGGRVELAIDPGQVRIGMHVLLYHGAAVVARGVVEDLSAGTAAARVLQTSAPSVALAQAARVHFTEPEVIDPPRAVGSVANHVFRQR